jgi:hypothetical protein
MAITTNSSIKVNAGTGSSRRMGLFMVSPRILDLVQNGSITQTGYFLLHWETS